MTGAVQYATGKRKYAIARAWVSPGSGEMVVNERSLEHYFPRPSLRSLIQFPIDVAGVAGKYDVRATVCGGGWSVPGRARVNSCCGSLLLTLRCGRPP